MYHPRLSGSYHDMGYKYGKLLYDKGVRMEQFITLTEEQYQFGLKSYDIMREIYPGMLEEMEGMAEGQQIDPLRFAVNLLNIGLFDKTIGCTCFAVNAKDGVFFAKNHDMFTVLKKTTESALYRTENKHVFLAQCDAIVGKQDGVNEHGLAAGVTFVAPKSIKPGINLIFIIRYILEHFKTITEAVEWLKTIPVSSTQNIVLADKSGDMAVVELAPHAMRVRDTGSGKSGGGRFALATNMFLHPDMEKYDNAPDPNWYNCQSRFDLVNQILTENSGAVDSSLIRDILSGKHGLTCKYKKELAFDTLWSFIVNLNSLEILRAEGNPSKAAFKKDNRLDWGMKRSQAKAVRR